MAQVVHEVLAGTNTEKAMPQAHRAYLLAQVNAARTLTVGGRPVIRNVPDKLSVSEDGGAGGVFLRAEFAREAAAHTIQLGTLECSRLLACARATRYWMAPAFGTRAGDVPLDTQLLLPTAPNSHAE